MKYLAKLGLCAALLFGGMSAVQAQNLQDVVYLKNGSILRGIIIEQVPNQSLKIKTADGSVFVCEFPQVLKITKEEPVGKSGHGSMYNRFASSFTRPAGYRGFVDFGGAIGTGDLGDGVVSLSTSHGYQFNPYLFLGAGIGMEYHTNWESFFVPVFADVRGYILPGRISPYVGLKVGYSFGDGSGLYLNPTVGASFMISKKFAMNLSLGYNLQKADMDYYYNDYYIGESKENIGGFTIKLGVEF